MCSDQCVTTSHIHRKYLFKHLATPLNNIKRGFAPLTPHALLRISHLGAPFGCTPTAQQWEPPAPPGSIWRCCKVLQLKTAKPIFSRNNFDESVSTNVYH